MATHVRPVRASDAAALAELLNAIVARGGTTAYETPFDAATLADELLTGAGVVCCFVAEGDDGALQSFQSVVRADDLPADVGDIATFTRIGAVQRGTGSALFARTAEAAATAGLAAINATIRADNAGGLAYYGRMGFVDHDVSRGIPLADGTPVDRIHRRYPLRT